MSAGIAIAGILLVVVIIIAIALTAWTFWPKEENGPAPPPPRSTNKVQKEATNIGPVPETETQSNALMNQPTNQPTMSSLAPASETQTTTQSTITITPETAVSNTIPTTQSVAPEPAITAPAPYVMGTIPNPATWTVVYDKLSEPGQDLGEAETNRLFAKTHVIKRECPECADTHKTIYYKRITPTGQFSVYNNMKNTWSKSGNELNTDFKLYSDAQDLNADKNGWMFCNYDDIVAGFRDCGPTEPVRYQWNTVTGGKKVKFSVLDGP